VGKGRGSSEVRSVGAVIALSRRITICNFCTTQVFLLEIERLDDVGYKVFTCSAHVVIRR
jgi:hypothetical protein